MKRMLSPLLVITLLAGLAGCSSLHKSGCGNKCQNQCSGCLSPFTGCQPVGLGWCGGCKSCGNAGCESQSCAGGETCGETGCQSCGAAKPVLWGLLGRGRYSRPAELEPMAAGPPTGAITYPYYTNRGPRDFLAENPPSIGP